MKITESKLREMIREVITELTGTATAAGAKKQGYESADTKSKKVDYDTKGADYTTKQADYDTKKSSRETLDAKKYRKATGPGRFQYSAAGRLGFSENPDWTSAKSDEDAAETAKDNALTAKNSAETAWNNAKEADLKKTVPKQKPPAGGGAGFGKGKSAGKGKGKGKKKGSDEE